MVCNLAILTHPQHSPLIGILGLIHYLQIYPQEVKLPAIAAIQYKNSLIWPRTSIAACSYHFIGPLRQSKAQSHRIC